jgi:ribosome biogenesis GTPase A
MRLFFGLHPRREFLFFIAHQQRGEGAFVIATDEQAMALCAIYAIPDHVVGEERPVRYLLNLLLSKKSSELKARYKLDSFDLDLEQLIEHIAKKRGCIKTGAQTDYEKLFKLVLHDFRSGDLGLICLQQPD